MMNSSAGDQASSARAMYYSHDTFGLGHLRRTLALARYFGSAVPGMSQLIVTGSPVADRFAYPPRTDSIKLPSVTKTPVGEYTPRALSAGIDEIVSMRRDLLLAAARNYRPDFLLIDHAPAGLRGEAVETLRYLRLNHPDTRLIVGLRDIVDEPAAVRRAWARDGSYELFDDVYDLILVYGNRSFYDVVSEYGLSSKAADKTRFVGYLGREPGIRSPEEVRASLGMQTDRLVVVTVGGGGDGRTIHEAMLRDLQAEQGTEFDTLFIGGPLLADGDRAEIRARLADRGNVHFIDFTDDMASYLAAADAVVSMGGYNTVCEILSLRRPAVIVPRCRPRKEQLIRASVLSSRGYVDMVDPRKLAPRRLLNQVRRLLESSASEPPVLPMDGLRNALGEVASLLGVPGDAAGELVRVPAYAGQLSGPGSTIATGR